jgi:tuftelin-interacting protein 11
MHQWKKGGTGSKKVKYVYKTADQVLEEGKWRKISKGEGGIGGGDLLAAKVKVVDMRGKEERILSGYHAINARQRKPDDDDEDDGTADGPRGIIGQKKPNFEVSLENC